MQHIYSLIESWVEAKRLPSAVIQVELDGETIALRAFGEATLQTRFDIASLTKVTATLPSILLLEQANEVSLNDTISSFIPQFPHTNVTLLHCLLHRTGLPGSLPYPQNRYSKEDIWHEICSRPLLSQPGDEMRYSDIGMILVGKVIEVVTNQSLSTFADQQVFKPLNMLHTLFTPSEQLHSSIAPTEWDDVTATYLQGHVHDEVSYRLNGISGSAGLFSTANDLSRYASMWLCPETYNLLSKATITKSISQPIDSRGIGWQVQDGTTTQLACGSSWPRGSFGHTGFTGTSLWLEPSSKLSVVFLTNAVHYGRQNHIIELRKILHQEIYNTIKHY